MFLISTQVNTASAGFLGRGYIFLFKYIQRLLKLVIENENYLRTKEKRGVDHFHFRSFCDP
jgi:hypothetical protein